MTKTKMYIFVILFDQNMTNTEHSKHTTRQDSKAIKFALITAPWKLNLNLTLYTQAVKLIVGNARKSALLVSQKNMRVMRHQC